MQNTLNNIAAIIGAIVFGAFGLVFARFGAFIIYDDFRRQGWVAVAGGSVFMAFGLGLAALMGYALHAQRRTTERQLTNPDKPWLWSGSWNSQDISDHAVGGVVGSWVLALIWNGITGATCWSMLVSKKPFQAPELLVLIFVVVGVAFLFNGVVTTLRAIRYGGSILHLSTLPGQIGGHLAGMIHIRHGLDPMGPARLRLSCSRTSNSGKNSTTTLVWENVVEVPQLPRDCAEIPVDLTISSGLPATRPWGNSWDSINWKLEASVATHGVSYRSSFAVPVFDAAATGMVGNELITDPSMPMSVKESNVGDASHAPEPANHPGIAIMRLAGGGCTFHFAAARNWGSTIVLTLIGAGFTEGTILVYQFHGGWLFILMLGLFAVIFDLAFVNGWVASGTVTARKEGLQINRGWPLIRIRRTVPAESISDITDSIGTTMGNTSYYRLEAKTAGGEVAIANGIRDRRVTQWVAAELLSSLGKRDPAGH